MDKGLSELRYNWVQKLFGCLLNEKQQQNAIKIIPKVRGKEGDGGSKCQWCLSTKVWTNASLSELSYKWVQKLFGYLLDEIHVQQENPKGEKYMYNKKTPEGKGKARVMVDRNVNVEALNSKVWTGASLNELSYNWYKSCLATYCMKYNMKIPVVRGKEGW